MKRFSFGGAQLWTVVAMVALLSGLAAAENQPTELRDELGSPGESELASTGSRCAVPGATTASTGAGCSSHGPGCSTSCSVPSASMSRCAEYGACSLYGDLSGATGDVLDMYIKEKARDGETYQDHTLPEFTAYALDGTEVSSDELMGRPTVLVTLAGHCSHSFQTLPILKELETDYAEQGIQVVGVFVNTGDAENVASFMKAYQPNYTVLASPDDQLGDTFDSHLVPTYLLVDGRGQVKQRLVGFQSKETVVSSMTTHLAQAVAPAAAPGDSAGR